MNSVPIDLSGLKGLHIPPTPDMFPLAMGWWFVILGIILFILLLYFGISAWVHSTRRYVLRRLKKIEQIEDTHEMLRQINQLAKRVAIARVGREKIAPLYEDEWVAFMNSLLKNPIFSKDYIDLLHKNMYAENQDITESWRKRILQDYGKWIRNSLKK